MPNALVNSVNKIPKHLTKRTVAARLIQNLSQKKNEGQKCLSTSFSSTWPLSPVLVMLKGDENVSNLAKTR